MGNSVHDSFCRAFLENLQAGGYKARALVAGLGSRGNFGSGLGSGVREVASAWRRKEGAGEIRLFKVSFVFAMYSQHFRISYSCF